MTTTVKIEAHCSRDKEVVISIVDHIGAEGYDVVIQDGETKELYAYDDREIRVREVIKVPK